MFVTFEGIDGSGKSTQAKILKEKLEESGYKVILTKEPGGTPFGELIRNILLNFDMDPYSEFLLFASDRRHHVKNLIIPKLKEGFIVISDRFHDSSVAYQGYGRRVPLDFISKVHKEILEGIEPDVTILVDVPVSIGINRLKSKDRIEKMGVNFLENVRKGYFELAKENKRFVVVDGTLKIETIANTIFDIIYGKLKWKR